MDNEINCIFVEAEKQLRSLSKAVMDGLKPPSGAYAFFHHNAHAISRLQDCEKILERMNLGKKRLIYLRCKENSLMPKDWPAGVSYPPKIQKVMKRESEVNRYMRIDFESLYMFGGILLDQWALNAIAIGNIKTAKKHPFVELFCILESEENALLKPIWDNLKGDMIWLHYQMRFYRNRFIVHANRPWQTGTFSSTMCSYYRLHTPTPPGWLDDEKVDSEIRLLINIAPDNIRESGYDWSKERADFLLGMLFDNIGNIEKRVDREKVASLYGKKGGLTPSYEVLAKNLFNFIFRATEILNHIVLDNLQNIDIGKPFATSEEMWIKRTAKNTNAE